MALLLPPTPVGVPPGHTYWNDWYEKLRMIVNGGVAWSTIDFAGSNLSDIQTRPHNVLQSIQGGAVNDYFHFTGTEHTDLTDGGDCTLHFHASDRARANHTGTQAITTISDYVTGTWTPAIAGTTTAGTGTYTAQVARYTKIGDVVHIYWAVTWTAHTGTGNMIITGLPFTATQAAIVPARFADLTYTGTSAYVATISSSTTMQIAQYSSGVPASNIPIDTSGSIVGQGIYFA